MKKKKIKEFLDINLTGEKLDQHMKEMLEEKFEHELKEKYSNILKSKYNIERESATVTAPKSKRTVPYILALIGIILSGYFTINLLLKKEAPKAHQYLAMAENQLNHLGSDRNQSSEKSLNKVKAYDAFNKKDYNSFNELMLSEKPLNLEDRFFLAYTKMYEERYAEALSEFNTLHDIMNSKQKYYQEIELYKALCLLEIDRVKFDKLYQGLENNSWAKKELNKILP